MQENKMHSIAKVKNHKKGCSKDFHLKHGIKENLTAIGLQLYILLKPCMILFIRHSNAPNKAMSNLSY